jgi:hypothetical protein
MPGRARLHSNWVYFAMVYTMVAIAMGALSVALEAFSLHVPGGEIGLSICGFIMAAILAGLRYVRAHGNIWTPRERHHLSLVYAFTSFVVSAAVMILVSLAIFLMGGSVDQLGSMLTDRTFQLILAGLLLVGLVIYYLLARFALFVVDRAAHAGAGAGQST